jgi:hypothetical protein
MLLFAFGVGRNSAGILKIQLNLFQWLSWLQRVVATDRLIQNAALLAQNLPDRFGGTRQGSAQGLQFGIAWEGIEQGFGSRYALQVFWRALAHLDDSLDDAWVNGGRRCFTSTRTGMEYGQIIGWRFAEALEPLFDETTGTTKTGSKLLVRPIRMLTSQAA